MVNVWDSGALYLCFSLRADKSIVRRADQRALSRHLSGGAICMQYAYDIILFDEKTYAPSIPDY
jgi:hypothetical protein